MKHVSLTIALLAISLTIPPKGQADTTYQFSPALGNTCRIIGNTSTCQMGFTTSHSQFVFSYGHKIGSVEIQETFYLKDPSLSSNPVFLLLNSHNIVSIENLILTCVRPPSVSRPSPTLTQKVYYIGQDENCNIEAIRLNN